MAGKALIMESTGYPVIDDALEELDKRIKKLEKHDHKDEKDEKKK